MLSGTTPEATGDIPAQAAVVLRRARLHFFIALGIFFVVSILGLFAYADGGDDIELSLFFASIAGLFAILQGSTFAELAFRARKFPSQPDSLTTPVSNALKATFLSVFGVFAFGVAIFSLYILIMTSGSSADVAGILYAPLMLISLGVAVSCAFYVAGYIRGLKRGK